MTEIVWCKRTRRLTQRHIHMSETDARADFQRIRENANNPKLFAAANAKVKRKRKR